MVNKKSWPNVSYSYATCVYVIILCFKAMVDRREEPFVGGTVPMPSLTSLEASNFETRSSSYFFANAPSAGPTEGDFERLFLADVEDIDNISVTSTSSRNSRSKSPTTGVFEPDEGTFVEKTDDDWTLLLESSRVVENTLLLFSSELKQQTNIVRESRVLPTWPIKPELVQSGEARSSDDIVNHGTSDACAQPQEEIDQPWLPVHNLCCAQTQSRQPSPTQFSGDHDEIVCELLSEMVASVAFVCSAHYAPIASDSPQQRDYITPAQTLDLFVAAQPYPSAIDGGNGGLVEDFEAPGVVPSVPDADYNAAPSPSKMHSADVEVSISASLKIEAELSRIHVDGMRVKVRFYSCDIMLDSP
jgi:hypothetical protein